MTDHLAVQSRRGIIDRRTALVGGLLLAAATGVTAPGRSAQANPAAIPREVAVSGIGITTQWLPGDLVSASTSAMVMETEMVSDPEPAVGTDFRHHLREPIDDALSRVTGGKGNDKKDCFSDRAVETSIDDEGLETLSHAQSFIYSGPLGNDTGRFFMSFSECLGGNLDHVDCTGGGTRQNGKLFSFKIKDAHIGSDGHLSKPGSNGVVWDKKHKKHLSSPREWHPSQIDFLPHPTDDDKGYLFVAERFQRKRVDVYKFERGGSKDDTLSYLGNITRDDGKGMGHVFLLQKYGYLWVVSRSGDAATGEAVEFKRAPVSQVFDGSGNLQLSKFKTVYKQNLGGFHVSAYPVTDSTNSTYLVAYDHGGGKDKMYKVAKFVWDGDLGISDGTGHSGGIKLESTSGEFTLSGSWYSGTVGREAECSAGCSHWVDGSGYFNVMGVHPFAVGDGNYVSMCRGKG